jgi:membrane protease YdiL (CAAX protease family)
VTAISEARPLYHRLARTDRYRWWTPIRELVLCVLLVVLLWVVAVVPFAVALGAGSDGVAGLLLLGAATAVMMPAAGLAARTTRGQWRALLSVDGHVRWRWFAVCLGVALAEGVVSVAADATFAALGAPLGPTRVAWVGWARFAPLAVSVVAAIPLQAAAEEVVFRGTLMQALGAWVRAPWFAMLVSSAVFALGHEWSLPSGVATSVFGLVCAWLTVRTGGLEAAIALHVLHNVSFFLAEAAGGRSSRWISESGVGVQWNAALVDVALAGLYGGAIAILDARRAREARFLSREPAKPDDLQLGEDGHHRSLQQDEGHAEAARFEPAGEEQRHAVHGPERVAGDDGPDHAAHHDVSAREHPDEDRIG